MVNINQCDFYLDIDLELVETNPMIPIIDSIDQT